MAIRRTVFQLALAIVVSLAPRPAGAQVAEARTLYSIDPAMLERIPQAQALSVDVFWCSGDQISESRRITAAETASAIATFARSRNGALSANAKPDVLIRSVRLRPLSEENLPRFDVGYGSNAILLPSRDEKLASFVKLMSEVGGFNLQTELSREPVPDYVRVVICQNVDISKIPPRVYFQIARKAQEAAARSAGRRLSEQIGNITVATGIEDVGETRSPTASEVRYFHEDDEELASRIARIVAGSIVSPVEPKHLRSLSGRASRGTIEVWLGKSYQPTKRTTYLVCAGEHRNRCPPGSEWIACYVPLEVWARGKTDCASFESKRLTSASGNRCGYEVREVTCTAAK